MEIRSSSDGSCERTVLGDAKRTDAKSDANARSVKPVIWFLNMRLRLGMDLVAAVWKNSQEMPKWWEGVATKGGDHGFNYLILPYRQQRRQTERPIGLQRSTL